MKENILFVIDSLHCAGAEKSLISLLTLLDYDKYDVDLLLFGYGGALEPLLPNEVNLLPPLEYTYFSNKPIKKSITSCYKPKSIQMLYSRLRYSYLLRTKSSTNAMKARYYWESVSSTIPINKKTYDIAISYAQGVPTFYVADKVRASKKFAWVNVSYRLEEQDKQFQSKYYCKYDNIVGVSESTKEIFIETFPEYAKKMVTIHDINNYQLIYNMSLMGESFQDHFTGIRILTIGRLAFQKGYDLALEACLQLKESGLHFRWYVLGVGPLQNEIEEYIRKYGLEDNFVLLGLHVNPYPFIKDCDVYVQTSRFEGYGIALAEARMLNKLIVTTAFDAVFSQMKPDQNGVVVGISSTEICEGILRLLNDAPLRDNILQYLRDEKKGNVEEIESFYSLIG